MARSDPPQDAPPPNYAPSHPQILVAPLPDAASFFRARTATGEVFVKGLGQARVLRLYVFPTIHSINLTDKPSSVQLHLENTLPEHPSIPILDFPNQTLFPPTQSSSSSSDSPFPTVNRFKIPLPTDSPLPGTLNLSSNKHGEIKWSLSVSLLLASGQIQTEYIQIEGTPQDTPVVDERFEEVEEVLERDGVRARLLLDTDRPRLGTLLRLGVEIRAMSRLKTGVAGLSTQPNPAVTLRPLRRVRVELFRRVRILAPSSTASSSTSPAPDDKQHLTLHYASGKSLRYPGLNPQHPPLRVLFTVPTAQLGSVADQSWGEITSSTPYHDVRFFVRVSIGFDGPGADWIVEKGIDVRPKIWKEPRQTRIPVLDSDVSDEQISEEMAREAYRLKGLDTVGVDGTFRESHTPGEDLPPPFEGGASAGPSGLPTFLESEAQRRTGEVPLPTEPPENEPLVPGFEDGDGEDGDRATSVGRRGSLGGELGTWVEVTSPYLFGARVADRYSTTGTRRFRSSLRLLAFPLVLAGVWTRPRKGTMRRALYAG